MKVDFSPKVEPTLTPDCDSAVYAKNIFIDTYDTECRIENCYICSDRDVSITNVS